MRAAAEDTCGPRSPSQRRTVLDFGAAEVPAVTRLQWLGFAPPDRSFTGPGPLAGSGGPSIGALTACSLPCPIAAQTPTRNASSDDVRRGRRRAMSGRSHLRGVPGTDAEIASGLYGRAPLPTGGRGAQQQQFRPVRAAPAEGHGPGGGLATVQIPLGFHLIAEIVAAS